MKRMRSKRELGFEALALELEIKDLEEAKTA